MVFIKLGVEVGIVFRVRHQIGLSGPIHVSDHTAIGAKALPEEGRPGGAKSGHEVEQDFRRRLAPLDRPIHENRSRLRWHEVVRFPQNLAEKRRQLQLRHGKCRVAFAVEEGLKIAQWQTVDLWCAH